MSKHLLWLWLWFGFGMLTYMVKRAFYLITGPNPVANSVGQFFKVAGVPLFFRTVVDSALYWACFTPTIVQAGLKFMGWETAAWVVSVLTQFAVAALFFGLTVDVLADWGIGAVFTKIPILKDWWPQMPGPLVLPSPQQGGK